MPGDSTMKRVAGQLYKLLTDRRYLPTAADDFQQLDEEFVRLMSGSDYDYTKHLPEIVDAIWHCDDNGLGELPFDAEAYNGTIDSFTRDSNDTNWTTGPAPTKWTR